jgi:hypothetical protein
MGVADIGSSEGSFSQAAGVVERARLLFEPARRAVVSWNTRTPQGRLRFRLLRAHAPATSWYDYAEWHPSGRKSFSPASDREGVRVDVDVIEADAPFDGVELFADGVAFDLAACATPVRNHPSQSYNGRAVLLDVPAYSQYAVEGERGWCSPASLAMVHAYHGLGADVEATALAVEDRAYNGTGNWSFNVAYSGSLGLRAAVVFLQNLDHAQRLIERGLPVIVSYAWREGELPGAPLPHSDGHLAVLCGFTASGDCAVNDPAAPGVRVVYPRAALEAIWLRNNGLAYAIAPPAVDYLSVVSSPA